MQIHYALFIDTPHEHLFRVRCHLPPTEDAYVLRMPVWTLGSYLVRDFAKHIVKIKAQVKGKDTPLHKLSPESWRLGPCKGPVVIEYSVYAFDNSIRGTYLDQFMGFINGAALFLQVEGLEKMPHKVSLHLSAALKKNWQIATTLNKQKDFCYLAGDYDALLDHPIMMGDLYSYDFDVAGTPHSFVLSKACKGDFKRLCKDLSRICKAQLEVFGGKAPFERYLFLARVEEDAYGGLEHRDSCALLCKESHFPLPHDTNQSEDYIAFLGLCSHEYFHAWNVKRIRPKAIVPADYTKPAYTSLLWLFEGFTSYYDDRALLTSGVITKEQYLELVGKVISKVIQTPGRGLQSLADASFDTWVKFYKPDENTPNSQISYYLKGSLVALALDMGLRLQKSSLSLDTIMQKLWENKNMLEHGIGEEDFEDLVSDVAGPQWKAFFDEAVRGTKDVDLSGLLAQFGISYCLPESRTPYLGAKLKKSDNYDVTLQHVYTNSPAQKAGLAPFDVLIALDGTRVRYHSFDTLLKQYCPGDTVQIHAFRRGKLIESTLTFGKDPAGECKLTVDKKASQKALQRQKSWLG